MSTMLETSLPFMVLIPTLMLPGMIQHTPQGISLLEKDVRNTEYRLDSQYNHLANAILTTSYQKG